MQSRIEQLREQLREYDRQYRNGTPNISDTEYDKLFAELKRLETESGEPVPADSPTQVVGSDLFGRRETVISKEVAHKVPMLSIENVYSDGELQEFGNKTSKLLNQNAGGAGVEWVVELKIDGVSLSLIYENGKLVQGITRGNGVVGNDISHNLDMLIDVPQTLNETFFNGAFCRNRDNARLEVRGEVYMLNSDLVVLNEEQQRANGKIYKNARNITAGTISLKDPNEETDKKKRHEILDEHQRRKLCFFAHSVGTYNGITAPTHWGFLRELESYGIPVAPHTQRFDTFQEAAEYCASLYSSKDNFLADLDFEIDGLVLKVNRFDQQEQLGATGHHPRWVIAYKVEKYEGTTTLREIRLQVGKTGTVTPVAELEPIELAGTTVSRASLHNAEEIERKDIRVGDVVVVEKAGKIIPHIVRVEKHLRQPDGLPLFEFPTQCPVCSQPLTKDIDGVYVRCNNLLCPAQFKEKLKHFASRNAMDIEGLGDKIIEQLVDGGLVKTFADLYRLNEKKEDLLKIDRQGKKSVDKLGEQIEKSKNRGFVSFLNALSIRHVGLGTARVLAKHFGTLDQLRNATVEELSQINEIGEVIAQSIAEFFRDESALIDDLLQYLSLSRNVNRNDETTAETASIDQVPQVLAGQTIVVTGTLEHFKRNEIEDVITKYGGKTSSGVSKRTSFVLVGAAPGSKLDKAKQLAVRIVEEPEFLTMIGQS